MAIAKRAASDATQPPPFERLIQRQGQKDIQDTQTARPDSKSALKPYRSYKPARVHWLGDIPAHWKEKRGKYFFREVDERSLAGDEELLSVSHTTGVTPRSQKNVTMFKAESYVGHKLASPHDIVINTMWAWMAALGVSRHVGIVSPSYAVYRPRDRRDYIPDFVDCLLRIPPLKWEYICRSTGIRASRLRLYPDKFLDITFPCPPREEQERIVAFLRAKERQVLRLIRNKRGIIALLNEQKQAITTQVVIRGLDPNAPMKPTGVEWMPEVPSHWTVAKLKRLAKMKSGGAITAEAIEESGPHPVYGGNGLRGYTGSYTHEGTFALIGRQGALCGNVHLISGQFWASEHAIVAALKSEMDIHWFVELLRTMNLNQYSEAAAQPGLSVDQIINLYVPIPPIDEQKCISDYFQREFSNVNAVINRTQKEIELVREYRERLISDVVTGKLDVRDVKIPATVGEAPFYGGEVVEEEMEAHDTYLMEEANADD
jgi:type I restriction enzyme S subunit